MEVGLLAGVEIVAGVERVVAVELVEGAVDAVGARLGQHVDLPARVAAELGAVGVRLDAELANRLGAERRSRGTAGRPVREIVLQRAVEQVDVRARILSVHAHGQPVRHHGAAVAMRIGEDAGLEQREVRVVAAVERQLIDRFRPDEKTELAAGGVDERRVAGHRHFFAQSADLERDVDDEGLGNRQQQIAPHVRLEAGELGAQLVGARRQPGDDVAALRVRGDRARQRGADVPDRDRDPGQHAAVGIVDGAGDRGGSLCRRRRGEQRDEEQGESEQDRAACTWAHQRETPWGRKTCVKQAILSPGQPPIVSGGLPATGLRVIKTRGPSGGSQLHPSLNDSRTQKHYRRS